VCKHLKGFFVFGEIVSVKIRIKVFIVKMILVSGLIL
jgi:hypothetical protein